MIPDCLDSRTLRIQLFPYQSPVLDGTQRRPPHWTSWTLVAGPQVYRLRSIPGAIEKMWQILPVGGSWMAVLPWHRRAPLSQYRCDQDEDIRLDQRICPWIWSSRCWFPPHRCSSYFERPKTQISLQHQDRSWSLVCGASSGWLDFVVRRTFWRSASRVIGGCDQAQVTKV
jgi:hypothetical protein